MLSFSECYQSTKTLPLLPSVRLSPLSPAAKLGHFENALISPPPPGPAAACQLSVDRRPDCLAGSLIVWTVVGFLIPNEPSFSYAEIQGLTFWTCQGSRALEAAHLLQPAIPTPRGIFTPWQKRQIIPLPHKHSSRMLLQIWGKGSLAHNSRV